MQKLNIEGFALDKTNQSHCISRKAILQETDFRSTYSAVYCYVHSLRNSLGKRVTHITRLRPTETLTRAQLEAHGAVARLREEEL